MFSLVWFDQGTLLIRFFRLFPRNSSHRSWYWFAVGVCHDVKVTQSLQFFNYLSICYVKKVLFKKVPFKTIKVKYKEIADNHLQASQSFDKIVAKVVRRDDKTA